MFTPLISLLLAAPGLLPGSPDTTGAALPHALKLGLNTTANGLLTTLAVERQLRPHLGVQSSLGYGGRTFSEFYAQPLPAAPLNTAPYTRRVRQAAATAQLRYYPGRKPLAGFYTGLSIGLAYLREAATRPQAAEQRSRTIVYPQLQAGGQWVFGSHLLLDVFVGLGAAQQTPGFSFAPAKHPYWDFYAANGLQLGYAF